LRHFGEIAFKVVLFRKPQPWLQSRHRLDEQHRGAGYPAGAEIGQCAIGVFEGIFRRGHLNVMLSREF
jgi:hypothetical protein